MAEEAATFAPRKAVIGRFCVRIVGDDAIVSSLWYLVSDDDGTFVCASSALRHGLVLLRLHLNHAFLGLTHVVCVITAFCLSSLPAHHVQETLAFLSSCR